MCCRTDLDNPRVGDGDAVRFPNDHPDLDLP
jgi:hypothetical protein